MYPILPNDAARSQPDGVAGVAAAFPPELDGFSDCSFDA